MLHKKHWIIIWLLACPVWAGERIIDFSKFILNQPVPGFRSAVTGEGRPGNWQTVLDAASETLGSATNASTKPTGRAVLAQIDQDPTDEHFPLLILENEIFGDFKLTTRVKTVAGERERMAGIAFRLQDEKNYYVVRASSLGNTLRFYKVIKGVRTPPIGPEFPISSGVWHDLVVECKGFRIRCLLDGKELIVGFDDDRLFAQGKIGFWTKSDSVSYFANTRIEFDAKESIAPLLVSDQLQKYPHLEGLSIYMRTNNMIMPSVIASNDQNDLGKPGGKIEQDVIDSNHLYCGIGKQFATVTMPLHDRNGDAIAAVRIRMKSFRGQTEQNALGRAMPILKSMEMRVRSREDLVP